MPEIPALLNKPCVAMKIIDDPNPTMGDIMPVIVDNYHAANECKDHYGQLMDFYNNERNEINKAIK